jgi:hypothetical protein
MLRPCRKCQKPANRPKLVVRKVVKNKREFEEKTFINQEYTCECGRSSFSGALKPEEIDNEHPFILDKFPDDYNGRESNLRSVD